MVPQEHVPCNGCVACCRHELIFLYPEDDQRQYLTRPATNPLDGRLGLALAQQPNGDCVYLGEAGCTIHDKAPAVCRAFDCRRWVLGLGDRAAIRRGLKAGAYDKAVVAAGKARLNTLEVTA